MEKGSREEHVSLVQSHWKISRKSGKSKKVGPFSRVRISERNVVFHLRFSLFVPVPGRSGTATYRGLRPNGTTFYQSEIPLLLPPKFPGFFPKWKAPIVPRGSSRRSLLFFVPYFSARLDFPSPRYLPWDSEDVIKPDWYRTMCN